MMARHLSKLGRFAWTLHNLLGHPLSEILFQVGLRRASEWVHDITIPAARTTAAIERGDHTAHAPGKGGEG